MISADLQLVCPAGNPDASPIILDLAYILAAEARQEEVATVTPFKAPELLRTYNKSWLELNTILARLQLERNKALKEVEKRKAVLLLDVIPEKLKERKIPSNDANREAFIVLDPQHSALEDTAMQITAIVKLLEGKLKSFENAFSSVKRIIGQDTYHLGGHGNERLSGGTERSPVAPEKPAPSPAPAGRPGFGKPRY